MSRYKNMFLGALLLGLLAIWATPAEAAGRRHYYNSWSYYPAQTYYYRTYYYRPYADYDGYRYHYCIHYPTRPQYVYYYNPYDHVYWGRYDLDAKGYSLLAKNDRKASLKDIPESAFPKPGAMPEIPESKDGEKIPEISKEDLPSKDAPKDVPAAEDAPRK